MPWTKVLQSGDAAEAPAIFYGTNTSTTNLGTSLGTIAYGTEVRKDARYTHTGNGEVTITTAGWYEFHWQVMCTGATSRVEIRCELQINSSKAKGAANYTARNSSQDTGGTAGHHVANISANDIVRVQALRDGSTANKIAGDCSLLIRSL